MTTASQSRHFNLHWLDQPQAWIRALGHLSPKDPKALWEWHVTHHQLLTLAKRSETDTTRSLLWFSIMALDDSAPWLAGIVMPGQRVAVIPRAPGSAHGDLTPGDLQELTRFLCMRLKVTSVMGSEPHLRTLGFLDPKSREIEHHASWGKRLSPTDTISDLRLHLTTRRASEVDRPTLTRWAKIFASDVGTDASSTIREVEAWMKRGRMYIFETGTPVGMTALSGDYTDAVLGRTCRLSLVFTDPAQRGRGIGREMLLSIEQEMRLEKASALVLYSDPRSERTRRFYSDFGFKTSADWLEVSLAGFTGINVSTTG